MSEKLRPEQLREQPGHHPVAQHMPAPIRLRGLMDARADHHIELLVEHARHQLGRARRLVGRVAVRHDIEVGIDVGEHPADDRALALDALGADHRARRARDLDGAVAAIVVVDVDRGRRQRRAELRHRPRDRRLFVVARQQDGDGRFGHAAPLVTPGAYPKVHGSAKR